MSRLLIFLATVLVVANSLSTPKKFIATESIVGLGITKDVKPLTRTVFFVSPDHCSEEIVYQLKATNTRISGLNNLRDACVSFEDQFQSEDGVDSSINRISVISSNNIIVSWNVTWINPSAGWLQALGNAWPGVDIAPTSYNHLSDRVNMVSWKAVGKLFADAIATGKLRIPQACIEGKSELSFSDEGKLEYVVEELSYAQDLQRRALLNRRCADDLRIFLETGRRIPTSNDWDDTVAQALPWSSVPGSNPLDLDPTEEGPFAAAVFLGVTLFVLLGFISFAAPEFIGQSLFGSPNYIVQPDDLKSIY